MAALPLRTVVGWALPCLLLLSCSRQAQAGSHPLSWTPFWHETSFEYVTVVKKNGALQEEPLPPGLLFTPYALFGETYTPMKVIPDTDCYMPVNTKTKDHIEYRIAVCVTNLVGPKNVVEVVRKLGFDYDTKALRIQTENAIKEVLMTYTWLDIEKTRSNALNEDVANKLGKELFEKYGEVGRFITVLGVTIQEKTCLSASLAKELAQQAQNQAQTATELLVSEFEQAKQATETAKVQAQEERLEIMRQANADREMAAIKATNERKELQNQQALRNAENAASIAKEKAAAGLEAERSTARLMEDNPEFASHERAKAYTEALGKSGSKFVLTDGINAQMQGSLTGGSMWSWLFGNSGNSGKPGNSPLSPLDLAAAAGECTARGPEATSAPSA